MPERDDERRRNELIRRANVARVRERPSIITRTRVAAGAINMDIGNPVIDRTLQVPDDEHGFVGYVEEISTYPESAKACIEGWVGSAHPGVDEDYIHGGDGYSTSKLFVPFPPNEKSFLEELKTARDFEYLVEGWYFIGRTTRVPLLNWLRVANFRDAP
jgi:hypothetical protein